MRRRTKWKSFMVWALMLALVVTTTPVFAGEAIAKDPADTSENVASDTGDKDFSDFDDQENVVWLHVVNGNFKVKDGQTLGGEYADSDISKMASVPVKLGDNRQLPSDILNKIEVTRTNGEFDGWYTKAPVEELQSDTESGGSYSVWHTVKKNGTKIDPGTAVPEGVNVLYAVFDDKSTAIAKEDNDKLVTFYLDWNGIDGMFGHCLTCTRAYKNGETRFTAEDAAVYNLNFDGEDQKKFDAAATGEEKWRILKETWTESDKTYNGYTFKGWSTDVEGNDMVWEDTEIKDGMSFYAQWEKGELNSKNFDRVDPAAGPLEAIRITGSGLSSSMTASRHAKAGESFTLNIFRTPVRAKAEDVTWKLTVSTSDKDNRYKINSTDVTVTADGTKPQEGCEGLDIKAEGDSLTITTKDDTERSVSVGVTAKSSDGDVVAAPANAVIGFAHTWNKGDMEGELTCTKGAKITYECTANDCDATKVETVPALGHRYEKLANEKYYTVTKAPTCTEAGEKQYKCVRCGDLDGPKATIPALGHDWKNTSVEAVSCNKDLVTKECQRSGCEAEESVLTSASHPQLHKWSETDRTHMSCMSDRVRERCTVCGTTKQYTEAANNPECHSYAYESRMPVNCELVEYKFKCVHGCGSTEVKLVREENHVWGSWKTTKAATTTAPGELARVCSRCEKKETKVIPQLKVEISYALNGGKNNVTNPTTLSKTVVLKSPTRSGYTFEGWYKDKKLKSKVTTITSAQKSDMTVYAKWQKVSVSKAKLSSVKKSGSKKAKVKFKKVSGAKGYEVAYSTNSKLKSSKKVTTKSTSTTLKSLKKNKKYYVKVRAYKTDSTGKKVYGNYSSVKSVKVK